MSEHRLPPEAGRKAGRFESALVRWLSRESVVSSVEALSAHFRLIELQGEALRGVPWSPGQKLQVSISGMKIARTYTPMDWDADRGATRILVWVHGDAPGCVWARSIAAGDSCVTFGPRRSIEIGETAAPIVLFGDETAFGLGHALREATPEGKLTCLFEATDAGECQPVLEHIGLGDALLVERTADEGHLASIEAKLEPLAQSDAIFVLSGRAPAIQRISRSLKALGVVSSRLRVKAYWSPGKIGLD